LEGPQSSQPSSIEVPSFFNFQFCKAKPCIAYIANFGGRAQQVSLILSGEAYKYMFIPLEHNYYLKPERDNITQNDMGAHEREWANAIGLVVLLRVK
jgi:hypothetical protein